MDAKEKDNNKTFILTARMGKDEEEMIKILRGHPHYINIAEYLRNCIKHLYDQRTNKAGRPK